MYIDLSDLVRKKNLGGADKRIEDRVATLRADYRAWVKYRVWVRTSVFLELLNYSFDFLDDFF